MPTYNASSSISTRASECSDASAAGRGELSTKSVATGAVLQTLSSSRPSMTGGVVVMRTACKVRWPRMDVVAAGSARAGGMRGTARGGAESVTSPARERGTWAAGGAHLEPPPSQVPRSRAGHDTFRPRTAKMDPMDELPQLMAGYQAGE